MIVLGSTNTDLVIRGSRLPSAGETVLGGRFFQAAGGKGANQAVAAARAGSAPVAFLGAVGDDEFGRQSLAGLKAENIDCQFVRVIPGASSGVALILVDARGENLISVASGANLLLTKHDVANPPDELFSAGRVFLASLEVPLLVVEAGLRRAKGAGLTTLLNPAPVSDAAAVRGLLPLVDVLTPNATEASLLAGLPVNSPHAAAAAAKELLAAGCRTVIVTLGAQGLLFATQNGIERHLPAFRVSAVDTTAAGDCFSGVLAAALESGAELPAAIRFAAAAAALSVTVAGAQPSLPRRAEIEAFLRMNEMTF